MFIQPIDYLLFGWFVLAVGSTIYVAWDSVPEQSRTVGDEMGLHPRHALSRSGRTAAVRARRQGTRPRHP